MCRQIKGESAHVHGIGHGFSVGDEEIPGINAHSRVLLGAELRCAQLKFPNGHPHPHRFARHSIVVGQHRIRPALIHVLGTQHPLRVVDLERKILRARLRDQAPGYKAPVRHMRHRVDQSGVIGDMERHPRRVRTSLALRVPAIDVLIRAKFLHDLRREGHSFTLGPPVSQAQRDRRQLCAEGYRLLLQKGIGGLHRVPEAHTESRQRQGGDKKRIFCIPIEQHQPVTVPSTFTAAGPLPWVSSSITSRRSVHIIPR